MPSSPWKLSLQLAARSGVASDWESRLVAAARGLQERAGPGARAALLVRIPEDPFAAFNPGMRGFEATLELRLPGPEPAERLIGAAAGIGAELERVAHLDLCAALVGVDHDIVAGPPAPLRYQYAMRRRADLDHAQYVAHYLAVHAEFGRRQPGVIGYTQFHVEPALARAASGAAGFGLWAIDSISELHLETLGAFTEALAAMPEADRNAPILDEENFVDRANSVMFVTRRAAL